MTTPADDPMQTRTTKPPQIFTPARIIAIALIALSVLGLAYLRFRPEAGSVSVPDGAKAGRLGDPAELTEQLGGLDCHERLLSNSVASQECAVTPRQASRVGETPNTGRLRTKSHAGLPAISQRPSIRLPAPPPEA